MDNMDLKLEDVNNGEGDFLDTLEVVREGIIEPTVDFEMENDLLDSDLDWDKDNSNSNELDLNVNTVGDISLDINDISDLDLDLDLGIENIELSDSPIILGESVEDVDMEERYFNIDVTDLPKTYELVKENIKKYDLLKASQSFYFNTMLRKRHDQQIKLENDFIQSFKTIRFEDEDLEEVNKLIERLSYDKFITIDILRINLENNTYIRDNLDGVIEKLTINHLVDTTDNLSAEHRQLIIEKLYKIKTYIEEFINKKKKDNISTSNSIEEFNPYPKPKSISKDLDSVAVLYGIKTIYKIKETNSKEVVYKLRARRGKILDETIPFDKLEKLYPETLTVIFSMSKGIMELSRIRSNIIQSIYENFCQQMGIGLENTEDIVKPFFILTDNKALILFNKTYIYEDFIEKAKIIFDETKKSQDSKVIYESVELSMDNFPSLFNEEISEVENKNFITYTNQELKNLVKNFLKKSEASRIFSEIFEIANSSKKASEPTIGLPEGLVLEKKQTKVESKLIETELNNKFINTTLKYLKKSKNYDENKSQELINVRNLINTFNKYKPIITLEVILHEFNRFKFIGKNILITGSIEDIIDLVILFGYQGLLSKLNLLNIERLSEEVLYNTFSSNLPEDLSFIDFIESKEFKKIYDNKTIFLKKYDESIGFALERMVSLLSLYREVEIVDIIEYKKRMNEQNNKKEKSRKELVTIENINRNNIKEAHKNIIEKILDYYFQVNNIEEPELIKELAQIYVSNLKVLEKDNLTPIEADAHVFLRMENYGTEEYNEDLIDFISEFNTKSLLNSEDIFKESLTIDLLRKILQDQILSKEYPNLNEEIIESIKGTDLLKDLNLMRVYIEDIDSIKKLFGDTLSIISKEMVNDYKKYTLLQKALIPTPTSTPSYEESKWVSIERDKKNFTFNTLTEMISKGESVTVYRDIQIINDIIGENVWKTYNPEKPKRFKRLMVNQFETYLNRDLEIIDSEILESFNTEAIGINIKELANNAYRKIYNICMSNYDLNYLITKIKYSIFYQSHFMVNEVVSQKLKGYEWYVNDANYLKVRDMVVAQNIISLLAPITSYQVELVYNSIFEENIRKVTSNMKKLNSYEMSSAGISKKKTNNALYKAYLNSGNQDILKYVNRDLVDFELLTQEPNGECKSYGEFSTYALVNETFALIKESDEEAYNDLDYFYTILKLESTNSIAIEDLPLPIIEFMKMPREIPELFKNDELLNNTKLEINIY